MRQESDLLVVASCYRNQAKLCPYQLIGLKALLFSLYIKMYSERGTKVTKSFILNIDVSVDSYYIFVMEDVTSFISS